MAVVQHTPSLLQTRPGPHCEAPGVQESPPRNGVGVTVGVDVDGGAQRSFTQLLDMQSLDCPQVPFGPTFW